MRPVACGVLASVRNDREAGQATGEYVALLMVVAIVLSGAAVLATGGGPPLRRWVLSALRAGVCRVGGHDCGTAGSSPWVPLGACVVAERERRAGGAIVVDSGRLGAGVAWTRVHRADGEVDVTLEGSVEAGVEAGLGAHGGLDLGPVHLHGGIDAGGSLGGRGRGVGTWRFASDREADHFVKGVRGWLRDRAIHATPAGPLWDLFSNADDFRFPPPAQVALDVGATAAGELRASGGPADALASASLAGAAGASYERATGETTVYLDAEAAGGARGALILSAGLSGAGRSRLAVVLDRHGHPLRLVVTASAGYAGRLGSSGDWAGLREIRDGLRRAGLRKLDGRGRRIDFSAELELTDAGNRAAVAGLLGARGPDSGAAAVRALAARIDATARISLLEYGQRSSHTGGGGHVGLGLEFGVEGSRDAADAWLLAARYRVPGLGTVRWTDCARAGNV